jgi:hypothetical protein
MTVKIRNLQSKQKRTKHGTIYTTIKNGTKRIWCDSHHMTQIIQMSPYTVLDRPCGFQEMEAPRISRQPTHEGGMGVRVVHQQIRLVLNCVRSSVDHNAIVRPEGLCQ